MDHPDNDKLEVILGTRNSGKTAQLLNWVQCGRPDQNRVILVRTEKEGRRLQQLDPRLRPEQVMTWARAEKSRGSRYTFGIDNAEHLLSHMLRSGDIAVLAMTGKPYSLAEAVV